MTLLVFPHCDIHLVLGDPALSSVEFKLYRQFQSGNAAQYTLSDQTGGGTYLTFSPYRATDRLQSAVTVTTSGSTGTITATQLGITFVVMKAAGMYTVARVQVHQSMVGWWFGNASLTTAVDPTFGHTQPSIYAQFSDDSEGTDLVGDITGHGFVPLSVANTSICAIDNRDNRARLRGVTAGTTTVSGTLLGLTQTVPLKVVDYTTSGRNLDVVKQGTRPSAQSHNMLFLAEGFTSSQADKDLFAKAVRETKDSLFRARRHEPFGSLKDSFHVFAAYEESEQNLMTVGYKVKDNGDGGVAQGVRLPPDRRDYTVSDSKYSVEELVQIVGLPMRGENRSTDDLKTLWAGQSLTGYEANKVDNAVVNAWKASTSVGILEARDTFFGLIVGRRYADQGWALDSNPVINAPATDVTTDGNLQSFVDAVYSWFRLRGSKRSVGLDPRRHPPELFAYSQESRDCAVMRYIRGSTLKAAPHTPVGIDWVPTPGTFIKSRGLVGIIVNDGVYGGINMNDNTLTSATINTSTRLGFEYDPGNPATQKKMRRNLSSAPSLNILNVINVVAHEFGHSFNLGDEYESRGGDATASTVRFDNLANFSTIQLTPVGATGREIDPTLVKWLKLPRIKRAARLVANATKVGANIEVMIDKDWVGPFDVAKHLNETVILRDWNPRDDGEQLHSVTEIRGLSVNDADFNTGKVVLSGTSIPGTLPATFGPGSMIYVQRQNETTQDLTLGEPKVLEHLSSNNLPLNKDPENQRVSREDDGPVSISDFKPPCSSSTLIGVFEGANYVSGKMYRPAGACKMRNQAGGFCHVCKWLITNRVDPNRHIWVDFEFYPEAKKNG